MAFHRLAHPAWPFTDPETVQRQTDLCVFPFLGAIAACSGILGPHCDCLQVRISLTLFLYPVLFPYRSCHKKTVVVIVVPPNIPVHGVLPFPLPFSPSLPFLKYSCKALRIFSLAATHFHRAILFLCRRCTRWPSATLTPLLFPHSLPRPRPGSACIATIPQAAPAATKL